MNQNWTHIITRASVWTITRAFMVVTAAFSFTHIIETSARLGLGAERWATPFLIDGFAVLGLIGRSGAFASSTRRMGTAIAFVSGALSLACNVYAGTNAGQRMFGILVVAVFIASETYSTRLRPAPTPQAAPEVSDELRAARSEAARKAAATRKANQAAAARSAAKANRDERRRIKVAEQALAAE